MATVWSISPQCFNVRVITPPLFNWILQANRYLLVNWRLAASVMHFVAILCIASFRHQLVERSFLSPLPPNLASTPEYEKAFASLSLAITTTFACLFVCFASTYLCCFTLHMGTMNLLHAGSHTIAAVFLIVTWLWGLHFVRVWHTAYIFSFIPTGIEILVGAMSIIRGLHPLNF